MSEKKEEMFHYTDSPKTKKAVDIYKNILDYIKAEFPKEDMAIVHLSTCLLEETCNRSLPMNELGDVLVSSARGLAPGIVTQVVKEEQEKNLNDGVFMMPGTDDIQ